MIDEDDEADQGNNARKRGYAPTKMTTCITLKVTQGLYLRLRHIARTKDLSMAEYVRHLLYTIVDVEEARELSYEIPSVTFYDHKRRPFNAPPPESIVEPVIAELKQKRKLGRPAGAKNKPKITLELEPLHEPTKPKRRGYQKKTQEYWDYLEMRKKAKEAEKL